MKKILFFHPTNDFSGSTTALANLIEKDYPKEVVDVVTDGNNGALNGIDNVRIIQIWYPHRNGKKVFGLSYLVKQFSLFVNAIIRRKEYDEYYLNTITVYSAALGARLCNKKVLWHIHEKFSYSSVFYAGFERKFMLFVFNRTICTRIYVSRYLQSQYKHNNKCLDVIKPNVLSQKYLSLVSVRPVECRSRDTIIMLASLTKAKGITTFIKLAEQLPQFSFILVISNTMENIVSFIGKPVPSNLQLFPKQDNIHPFMRRSDLLLNLSDPAYAVETFGMTIIEAMAYGVPAIVPNIGGPTEIVKDGFNGFCVNVMDIDLLTRTILNVLSDVDIYNSMVDNCLNEYKRYC